MSDQIPRSLPNVGEERPPANAHQKIADALALPDAEDIEFEPVRVSLDFGIEAR